MSWLILFLAGLTEVGWAVGLKYVDGFSRPWPLIATVGSMVISLYLLGLALKTIPLGTAYPIWTGIGILGTFLAGVFLFQEPVSPMKIASVCLLMLGIVGLKMH